MDLLGPLRLLVDGQVVEVPGPKRRALLALLTMAAGRTVPVDDLLAALWPGDLPETARATLQSHVSRLRAHLGSAAARLEGSPGAYRLDLGDGPAGTDLAQARALVDASKTATPGEARRLLGQAGALWRGDALVEFGDVPPLAAWAVAVAELRRIVDERLIEATLEAGDTGAAAAAATEHAVAEPHSEPAVLLLMRALHANGRTAEALRTGYDYRRRLREDTGLDPTPAVGALESELAAASTLPAGGITRPPQTLWGRDSELAALRRLVADERLVTVVGPGGVGKTRLATELAAGFQPATAVPLASVTDGSTIPYALADALDLQVVHGHPLPACAALLAAGPHLLLLDNCEHLLAGVGQVASFLLGSCPELRVLDTSREPLGLPAEQRLRLAPLSVVRPRDLGDVARSPAVAVFLDRARRVRPGFAPGPRELDLIAHIVRRLDGMPLAIELAAARLSSLGLADLHDRIDGALDLLGDDRAGTLRSTIAWSYQLLPEDEQRLFRFLSAFPDGLDLTDAEALAADLGLGPGATRALAHLADASMVEVSLGPATRYRMLDTVRSFASAQLVEDGTLDTATERFLTWALDLAAWVDRTIDTAEEGGADAALRRELPNLRAAWASLRGAGRTPDAMRLITGLSEAAGWRDLTEVWDWSVELAADPVVREHPGATAIFSIASGSAWSQGDLDRAETLATAGLELGGEDRWRCVAARALVALSRGDLDAAISASAYAGEHATRPEQSFGIAALGAAYQGDFEAARAFNDRLGTIARSPTLRAFHSYVAGEIDALAGRNEAAVAHYTAAIDLARPVGSTFVDGIASVGLLSAYARAGRTADALDGYRNLIDYWERTGAWVQQWTTLRNLADLLSACGDAESATFLRAAAAHAPDAPPVPDADRAASGVRVHRDAASASRERVLQVARLAIDRLATTPPPEPELPAAPGWAPSVEEDA